MIVAIHKAVVFRVDVKGESLGAHAPRGDITQSLETRGVKVGTNSAHAKSTVLGFNDSKKVDGSSVPGGAFGGAPSGSVRGLKTITNL
jgi:hypothetical protein